MGFVATDLATVPHGPRYSWYLFLLEDQWQDDVRRHLEENFMVLAREVGPDALVVRGTHPDRFYSEVLDKYVLRDRMNRGERILPAILVTDTPPHDLRHNDASVPKARIALFPLASLAGRPGDVTAFLKLLCETVRSPESFEALERLDRQGTRRRWGWVTRYLELKPNFFGFGVDIDAMIDDFWGAPGTTA